MFLNFIFKKMKKKLEICIELVLKLSERNWLNKKAKYSEINIFRKTKTLFFLDLLPKYFFLQIKLRCFCCFRLKSKISRWKYEIKIKLSKSNRIVNDRWVCLYFLSFHLVYYKYDSEKMSEKQRKRNKTRIRIILQYILKFHTKI